MPNELTYKLAKASSDYRACHRFIHQVISEEGNEFDVLPMTFPTLMAFQDGEMIGFVSRMSRSDILAIGSIAVKRGRLRPVIMGKLMDRMEELFSSTGGITHYYIPVQKGRPDLIDIVSDFAERLDDTGDGNIWFKRILPSVERMVH